MKFSMKLVYPDSLQSDINIAYLSKKRLTGQRSPGKTGRVHRLLAAGLVVEVPQCLMKR